MSGLPGIAAQVGKEEGGALSLGKSDAGINDPGPASSMNRVPEPLAFRVVVGMQGRLVRRFCRTQVIKIGRDVQNDFPELSSPSRSLLGRGHEASLMMNCFEERNLEPVASVQ